MEKYLVGGWCRDTLLGKEPKDRDWVVIGETPKSMIAKGFGMVGQKFPVFLDYLGEGDEHALARTETKAGQGHQGFSCFWEGTTLEEDLLRRDFTINAIAYDVEKEEFIDPFAFRKDIDAMLLRPINEFFHEDALRVYRAARFLALYPELKPTDELYRECKLAIDELDNISPERKWKELEKVLLNKGDLCRFFKFLSEVGACDLWEALEATPQPVEHHPEGNVAIHTEMVTKYAQRTFDDPVITFAAFCHDVGKPISHRINGNLYDHGKMGLTVIDELSKVYRLPNEYKDAADSVSEFHTVIHQALKTGATISKKKLLSIIKHHNGFKTDRKLGILLAVCISDARGRGGNEEECAMFLNKEYPQAHLFKEAITRLRGIDNAKVIGDLKDGNRISEVIHKVNLNTCAAAISNFNPSGDSLAVIKNLLGTEL